MRFRVLNRASQRSEDATLPASGLFVECSSFRPSGGGFTPHAYQPNVSISFDSFVSAVLDEIAVRDAAEAEAEAEVSKSKPRAKAASR